MYLSEVLDAIRQDEDLKKIASDRSKEAMVPAAAQEMVTSMSPAPEAAEPAMMGATQEDQKALLRGQLMEMAGAENDAKSNADMEEELNTDNKPTAGAQEVMPPAAPPQMVVEPSDLAAAAVETVGEMPAAQQKEAALEVIEKLASQFLAEELAEEESYEASFQEDLEKEAAEEAVKVAQEWDALGRIAARGYWDELNKLASASLEAEEG